MTTEGSTNGAPSAVDRATSLIIFKERIHFTAFLMKT